MKNPPPLSAPVARYRVAYAAMGDAMKAAKIARKGGDPVAIAAKAKILNDALVVMVAARAAIPK
jgi:hypothetical protein